MLGTSESRPNLIANLHGPEDGPALVFLGHVDTVLADAGEWRHDPWSGDVEDGFLWGRGALDMKSQVAAEAVAGASLARAGWRPARGTLRLVFVADEETGGDVGAQWLCREHPDKVRCDMLLNEGGGEVFEYDGQRRYGVCCAEKGIFRFTITAIGSAGHASLPKTGDNALLKLGPVLEKLAAAGPSFDVTDGPAALLRGLGQDAEDPAAALEQIGASAARAADVHRADARGDADPDDGPRLRQGQRDPLTRDAEGRLPGSSRTRRGGGAGADPGGARRALRAGRDQVHRDRDRQPVADRHAADGHDRPVDHRQRSRREPRCR